MQIIHLTAASVADVDRRSRCRCGRSATVVLQLTALLGSAAADSQELLVFASSYADPGYVGQHASWIELRPFDGMVINEFLGRNLLNTKLKADAPNSLDASTGAVTYDAAAKDLAPLKGAFKKFHHNFAKVNFNMVGSPPLLNDDAGWLVAYQSATNYAQAVRETGLKGIFFDNETYLHPPLSGRKNGADYWLYEDQITLAGQSQSVLPLSAAAALARRRGRELVQAFVRGYPAITVIVAHGPHEGCDAWRSATGHFGMDHYLLGAFAAGMVEGTPAGATLVDGGEDYDLRTARDFSLARAWRKGLAVQGVPGITNLGPLKCPFMDASLAAGWQGKVSIAFSTFDKERASLQTNNWTAIVDVATFRTTLTNALRATDQYVWHYTEWQDWWGNTMEDALKPWSDAIEAARRDARATPESHSVSSAGHSSPPAR
jgi:hypothetical protein